MTFDTDSSPLARAGRTPQVLARAARLLLVASALFAAAPSRAQGLEDAGLTDSIDIADARSERAHGLGWGGDVRREIVGDWVGDHDARRLSRTVRGAGSWVSYRLRVRPRLATTLEIEERDGRGRDVRGYLVFIDGRKTFLRTWQGSGAGPLHFFVQFPPTGKAQVELRMANVGAAPFSVSRLWAFAGFGKYFERAGLGVPYFMAPMLRLNPDDFAGDLAKLSAIKASLGEQPRARAAWGTWITYAALGARDTERLIDHALSLAQSSAMPVQLAFDTWWASTPGGLDGAGGFWSDVAYQQVVYNVTQRRFQLSIPNRWSSVPWLSVNQQRLNDFKARRLRETMRYLSRRLAGLRAQGQPGPLLAISLDNEPVYWASGAAGLGSDLLLADFNPQAVAAARQDNIALDPLDGLSFAERRWLQGNLLRYHRLIADAAREGLSDAAVVTAAGMAAPDDLTSHNIYTQAWIANGDSQFPMQSSAYPLWENAAPRGARIGGEWNGDSLRESQALQHMIALGRNAGVNAEAGGKAEENLGVRPGYALAQRFYTPYNYPLDKMDVLTRELSSSQPFPTHRYLPTLRENDFRGEGWKSQVVAWGCLEPGLIGSVAVVNPASTTQPGFLLYKVEAPRAASTSATASASTSRGTFSSLFLELEGRAFVFKQKDSNVQIRVLAGPEPKPEPEAMRELGRVFDEGDMNAVHQVDLSSVALQAPGIPETVRSWSSLHHVRFSTGWPVQATQNLPAQDESLDTTRAQNLLASWRSDAEDAIAQLQPLVKLSSGATLWRSGARPRPFELLGQAQGAWARADYARSYRLANQGLSLSLPAVFQVQKSGWLGPYAVRLQAAEAAGALWCRLLECTPQRVRLELKAASATPVQVLVGGLKPGAGYAASATGEGEWTLRRAGRAAGAVLRADARGELRLSLRAAAWAEPAEPEAISGVFRSGSGAAGAQSIVMFAPEGSNRLAVPLDARSVLRRGAEGAAATPSTLADFRFGDQIEVRRGPSGAALEATARYREVAGRVRAFGTLTPFAMPFIELEGGPERYTIDLLAPLHLPAGEATFRTTGPDQIQLAPGAQVRVRLNPTLKRAFELWTVPAP